MSTAGQPDRKGRAPRSKVLRLSLVTLVLIVLSRGNGMAQASGQMGKTAKFRVSSSRVESPAAPSVVARPGQHFPIIPAGSPVLAVPSRPHAGYAATRPVGSHVVGACSRAPCGRHTVSGQERNP